MTVSMKTARNAIRQTAIDAGYKFCMKSDDYVGNTSTMTADISQRYDGNHFVISCGCDHRLPQADRDRLWGEHGQRLVALLGERGFEPDLKIFGYDYRSIVVRVGE